MKAEQGFLGMFVEIYKEKKLFLLNNWAKLFREVSNEKVFDCFISHCVACSILYSPNQKATI